MSLDSVTEYALSFSEDAVHLLHREKVPGHRVGWRHIGSVEFASAEFRTELADLRAMATGGAEDQMLPVTLLIPDDQILYTTLTVTPGADRERAVGKALDGLTPYAVEDLAFDWSGDGDSVRVAAVARQTLQEAQGFAARYGFDGHSYRADPRPGSFPDEPVFALDMKQKPGRPGIDLSQAGVTSAGLQVGQDEAETGLDLDLQPDAVIATEVEEKQGAAAEISDEVQERAAEVISAKDAAPAEAAGAAVADNLTDDTKNALEAVDSEVVTASVITEAKGDDQPATVTQSTPDEAASASEDQAAEIAAPSKDAVPEIATKDEQAALPLAAERAEPSVATEPKAEDAQLPPVTEVEASNAERPAAAEPEADSAEAPVAANSQADRAESPVAEPQPEAEATASPVVRHAPVRQGGKPLAAPIGPGGKLNARAQAFHNRAAEARQGTAAPAADARPKLPRDRNGLSSLLLMLVVLVVGLFFAWAFLVPGSKAPDAPQDVADVVPPAATSSEPVEAPVETAPVAAQPGAPAATTPANLTPTNPTPVNPVAPTNTAQTVAPTPAPLETAEAPRVSALTPVEQRRAIVAAAAVAAAVVPPAQTPATVPAPAEPTPAPAAQAAAPNTPAPVAVAPATPARTAPTQPEITASRPAAPRPATPAPRSTSAPAAQTAPAPAVRLTSSARPMLSPRRTTPVTSTPRTDSAPAVPANPLPYEAAQRSVQPKSSARPPARATQRRATPVVAPAAPAAVTQGASLRGSSRPPSRPEGSVPDFDADAALTPQDQFLLDQQMRDLRAAMGVQAQAATPHAPVRLAQARPTRRPSSLTASDAVSASAVSAALQQAADSPPGRPAASASAAAPARDSGGLLRSTSRPRARPSLGGAVASSAVESAVADAVNASAATPGGVKLSALSGSAHPPRRSAGAAAAAAALAATPAAAPDAAPAAAETPPPAEQVVAANQGPSEAELAARRRLDEQLQAQAEARIRARAQADAAAEAQARAQAEARARAQAQAEERAAAARRQTYKPPEVDDEPEVMAALPRGGQTSASVARSATQSRGIDLGRTTIIGIIGAGNASRALIRLRNGKIVTVRLGDRIDGGTINSIGDGKLTYVKAGQQRELRLLDGR